MNAQVLRDAAGASMQMDGTRCPGVNDLIKQRAIPQDFGSDPWGHDYRTVCDGSKAHVSSDGADGVAGTADDIHDDATPSDLERISHL